MFVRKLEEVEKTDRFVEWGAGTSHRLITRDDEMGFTVCHTVVSPGTESLLQYRNHLEACYCVSGEGEIEDEHGVVYAISPGVIYALDQHDRHYLRNKSDQALILISVFNPPLNGTEVHNLKDEIGSSY